MWVDEEEKKIEHERFRKTNLKYNKTIFLRFLSLLMVFFIPLTLHSFPANQEAGCFGWKCYKCGYLNGNSFNTCQNCGTRK